MHTYLYKNMIRQISYFVLLILFANCEEEIGSPLRIAQCRTYCVEKFLSNNSNTQSSCIQNSNCFMCWENCQLLQTNYGIWGKLCEEPTICLPGCKEACRFHEDMIQVQQTVPVIKTRGEEVIFVKNQTAYWPAPAKMKNGVNSPLVYVVMRRLPGRMWRQITQTLELTSRIPNDLSFGAMLRVLVVNKEGLLTIYSPIDTDISLRRIKEVASTSGRRDIESLLSPSVSSNVNQINHPKRINTEILNPTEETVNSSETVERSFWNIREISLIHQKVLVIAEIGWDAVPSYVIDRPVYFVTWEVDGGGLKGNLFTDSTCVTLSLWPDTVYHIQVELIGHDRETGRVQQSEDFILDTHRAIAVELETTAPDLVTPQSPEIFYNSDSNEINIELPYHRNNNHHTHQRQQQQQYDHLSAAHKTKIQPEGEQKEVVLAIIAAFLLFVLVLTVLVYASCRHSDILSYPKPNMDIYSLKTDKVNLIDYAHLPKDIVPVLTVVTEKRDSSIEKGIYGKRNNNNDCHKNIIKNDDESSSKKELSYPPKKHSTCFNKPNFVHYKSLPQV